MKQRKQVSVKWTLFVLALCIALLVGCYFGRHYLMDSAPFASEYVFDGPSGVFPGADGRTYVVDKGKKSVLIVNGQGEIIRIVDGGEDSEKQFFYASLVAEGGDGGVYIAEVRYAREGTRIRQERIFRYDARGLNPTLVYSIDYENSDSPPMQYGNIKSLFERDGKLIFAVKTQDGVDVRTLETATGEVVSVSYALPGQYLTDVEADPLTGRPVFTNRLGQVCAVDESGAVQVLVDDGGIAWNLCTDGNDIYYTELSSKKLMRLDGTGAKTTAVVGDSVLFTAQMRDGRVCTTDNIGYYVFDGGETVYVESLLFSQPMLRMSLWAALCLGAVLLVVFVYLAVIRPQAGKKKSATIQRMLIVISVSACVSVLVTYITVSHMFVSQNESIMEQLNFCNDIMVQQTDVETLKRIDSVSDYRNADYEAVKGQLDRIMDTTYDNGVYYYYVVYATDGETIYVVMDYEDSVTACYPTYDWGVEGYTDVLASGETVSVSADVSSYGSWSFVLKPILDADGTPVAIMEVGINLDDFNAQNRTLIWEILLTVASMTVVLMMLIMEVIFYAEQREKRREREQTSHLFGPSQHFPLRTMVFLTFLADCLQDPFVSILANQLYTPIWGIPQSLGAALPLSAQVLTAALFAFVCGQLVRRIGVKGMLVTGYVLQIAGFVTCGVTMNYFGLLLGKALIGMGMGAIIVSLNAISAASNTEGESAEAFTAVNAGTLAGITVGAGIGSIVLTFSGFETVYYAGALILLLGLLIAATGSNYKESATERSRGRMNILRFLLDKSTWSFLLLILMPFLIAISFREYLFPIYAAQTGISETDIGRIYLLCGLFVIYAGPHLTKTFINRLGGKWTVVLASVLITAATLLFGFSPTLLAAGISLLLLSVAIAFGYAAQSTYYAGLPRVGEYGEGRAMGVYSLFDNGGQTLGPILYGVALLLGYQQGVLLIGAALLLLLLLFVTVNSGMRRKAHRSQKTEHGDSTLKGEL